ncbi:hypothetical protein AHAS_Ahas02G0188500 [Arachis hypogaea]
MALTKKGDKRSNSIIHIVIIVIVRRNWERGMSIKPERNRVKQTKKEGGIEIGVPRDQHLLLKTSNQIHTDWNLVLAPISPNEGPLLSFECIEWHPANRVGRQYEYAQSLLCLHKPSQLISIATLFGEYSTMIGARYMTNGYNNGDVIAVDCERGIYN